MTPTDFKAARKYLGLTQSEMALVLRLNSGRAVRAYEDGSREISGPISICVAYMLRNGLLPELSKTVVEAKEKRERPGRLLVRRPHP